MSNILVVDDHGLVDTINELLEDSPESEKKRFTKASSLKYVALDHMFEGEAVLIFVDDLDSLKYSEAHGHIIIDKMNIEYQLFVMPYEESVPRCALLTESLTFPDRQILTYRNLEDIEPKKSSHNPHTAAELMQIDEYGVPWDDEGEHPIRIDTLLEIYSDSNGKWGKDLYALHFEDEVFAYVTSDGKYGDDYTLHKVNGKVFGKALAFIETLKDTPEEIYKLDDEIDMPRELLDLYYEEIKDVSVKS